MISWLKNHKLVVTLIVIILILLLKGMATPYGAKFQQVSTTGARGGDFGGSVGLSAPVMEKMTSDVIYPPGPEVPPTDVNAKDRLVIQNSEVSLLVEKVTEVRNKIVAFAEGNGGYMVNSYVSNPQDAPTATVTIRIDSTKLQTALDYFQSLAIKVVSENLSGYDVTDEYVDVEKRIAILEQTKAKFTEILTSTREVSDIINLNQQIINIQSQIDSYKGQQEALKQNAKLARLTIYLSTDEMALPYAPSETFRPSVIFKLAIRSLVGHLRTFATYLIWIGVYAVIWLPSLVVGRWVYRRYKRSNLS